MLRKSKDYTVIATNKDGIKFQNEKLERYSSQFIEIKERYEQTQKEVVEDIVKLSSNSIFTTFCLKAIIEKFNLLYYLVGYLDDLQSLNNLVAELDVFVSFAVVISGSQSEYVKPLLHPLGWFCTCSYIFLNYAN